MAWLWSQLQSQMQQWWHRLDPNAPPPGDVAGAGGEEPVAFLAEQLAQLRHQLQTLPPPRPKPKRSPPHSPKL